MSNKLFIFPVILIFLISGIVFAYKQYSVDKQKQKEIEVIKAQFEKERDILEEKQKEKDQRTGLIEECIAEATEAVRQRIDVWKKSGFSTTVEEVQKTCNSQPSITVQKYCWETYKEIFSDLSKDFEADRERCYRLHN